MFEFQTSSTRFAGGEWQTYRHVNWPPPTLEDYSPRLVPLPPWERHQDTKVHTRWVGHQADEDPVARRWREDEAIAYGYTTAPSPWPEWPGGRNLICRILLAPFVVLAVICARMVQAALILLLNLLPLCFGVGIVVGAVWLLISACPSR